MAVAAIGVKMRDSEKVVGAWGAFQETCGMLCKIASGFIDTSKPKSSFLSLLGFNIFVNDLSDVLQVYRHLNAREILKVPTV